MNSSAIEARALTKTYGTTVAVDSVDFTVQPGRVTGFLGPNGAGKSTTMRMVLGLDRPSQGTVTVGDRHYRPRRPAARGGGPAGRHAVHPGAPPATTCAAWRTATASRAAGSRRSSVWSGSSGRQTSGPASSPSAWASGSASRRPSWATRGCVLDEPVNGLDPEGIRWIRNLMRSLAAEGRTVFVSSHLMSEMALTADHLMVIGAALSSPTPACPTSSTDTPAPRTGPFTSGRRPGRPAGTRRFAARTGRDGERRDPRAHRQHRRGR